MNRFLKFRSPLALLLMGLIMLFTMGGKTYDLIRLGFSGVEGKAVVISSLPSKCVGRMKNETDCFNTKIDIYGETRTIVGHTKYTSDFAVTYLPSDKSIYEFGEKSTEGFAYVKEKSDELFLIISFLSLLVCAVATAWLIIAAKKIED